MTFRDKFVIDLPRAGSGAQRELKKNFQERGTMSFGDKDDDINDREGDQANPPNYLAPSFREGDYSF